MARRMRGEGTVFPAHGTRFGCPPLDENGDRPKHRCKAPWVGSISLIIGGKRVRKTAQGRTRTEANDALTRMKLQLREGILPDSITLSEWLTHWDKIREAEYRAGELKYSALLANRSHVETWIRPTLGKVKLQEVTPEHVRMLKTALSAAKLAAQTQRNVHATLRAALARAMADRRITYNAAAVERAPKRPKKLAVGHRPLSIELVQGMLAMCETPRELARIAVGLTSGLRPGEILALRWEDVLLTEKDGVVKGGLHANGTVSRVEGKLMRTEPKTESSDRQVPLLPMTAAALWQWRAESGGEGFVFHGHGGPDWPESPERDGRVWRKIAWATGIADFTPHGGRATTGSVLMALNVPLPTIADILGHSQVSTTAEWYTHSNPEQRLAAIEQYGAALELDPEDEE